MDLGVRRFNILPSYVRLPASTVADSIAEAAGWNARLAVKADSQLNAVTKDQLALKQRAAVQGSAASPVTLLLALAAESAAVRNGSQACETQAAFHPSCQLPQVP